MRLAEFIVSHREPILKEWEAFARTCKPACVDMDIAALRDHAKEMLGVIAKDLESPQTGEEQSEKSKGRSDALDDATATAAQEHGAGRAGSGNGSGVSCEARSAFRPASVCSITVLVVWSSTSDRSSSTARFSRLRSRVWMYP